MDGQAAAAHMQRITIAIIGVMFFVFGFVTWLNGPLIAFVIQAKQLITLRKPVDVADEVLLERVLDEACRFLATATGGVYQVDGRGWFAADGELLVQEY